MVGTRTWLALGVVATLAGCGPAVAPVLGVYAGVEIASVAVFHRGLGDLVVSAVLGRDCSIVRLDRGLSYCVPVLPPAPAAYCTRTLGRVECFDALPVGAAGVADPAYSTGVAQP